MANKVYILFLSCLFPFCIRAQVATADTTNMVEIIWADSLRIDKGEAVEVRKLFGNVKLRHEGTIMYCDKAFQHVETNFIEAFGNVKVVQGDTITVTGDTLNYFSESKLAIMRGKHARLKDATRTLTSKSLVYDMQNGLASYNTPGVTVDKSDTLSSDMGTYNLRTKVYTYDKNVKLVTPKYTLTTDTLVFESLTKWTFFRGNTNIVNKDGTLSGKRGRHNTESGASIFDTRTTVINESYTLTGDSLYYDEPKQEGYAKGKVEIVAKKDSTVLVGDEAIYRGAEGFSKIFGHAVVKTVLSMDTLFIRADTLYSIENKLDSSRKMIADKNVFIYKTDFQGICDSLTYTTSDSIINFYKKPVLWGDNNQLEADSVTVWLVNSKVNRMHLRGNSFVISEDTLIHQHNQVKGRTIMAYFNERSKVDKVDVDGNGESIYYAIDDKEVVIGLNRVLCGKMNIKFLEDKVHRIAFLGRPDGKLIPPHQIKATERLLEGFNWRISQKPTKSVTTWQTENSETNDKAGEL
jgi:lipopolysaccharide export system protein LptA